MDQKLSSPLVSTAWLAEQLGDPNLRVFDCTAFLHFNEDEGVWATDAREEYEAEHIPGAAYVDLVNDLSDQTPGVPFMMMPSSGVFSRALSSAGLGDEHYVVIYSAGSIMWATRLWWMLRASGFTNAAVLDGGLKQWRAEGRPKATGTESYPAAVLAPLSTPWS